MAVERLLEQAQADVCRVVDGLDRVVQDQVFGASRLRGAEHAARVNQSELARLTQQVLSLMLDLFLVSRALFEDLGAVNDGRECAEAGEEQRACQPWSPARLRPADGGPDGLGSQLEPDRDAHGREPRSRRHVRHQEREHDVEEWVRAESHGLEPACDEERGDEGHEREFGFECPGRVRPPKSPGTAEHVPRDRGHERDRDALQGSRERDA